MNSAHARQPQKIEIFTSTPRWGLFQTNKLIAHDTTVILPIDHLVGAGEIE
jgi:hypothetical protein